MPRVGGGKRRRLNFTDSETLFLIDKDSEAMYAPQKDSPFRRDQFDPSLCYGNAYIRLLELKNVQVQDRLGV